MRAWEMTEAQNTGFQIYCDMDGVIVDFIGGVKEFMSDKIADYNMKNKEHSNAFWKKLGYINKQDPEEARALWANLSWMPDGKQLWSYIRKYDPVILSSPGTSSRAIIEGGKQEWIKRELGNVKYIFEPAKWKYAAPKPGMQNILIDDTPKKLDPWVDAGGIGILHTSAAETIRQLKEYKL